MSETPHDPTPEENNEKRVTDAHKPEEEERGFTPSISEEDRQRSFAFEDARWATNKQIGDWLKLGLMILVYVAWCLIVYFLEPGLR